MGEYQPGRTLAWALTVFLGARVVTDVIALVGQAVVTFVLGSSLEAYPDVSSPAFLVAALLLTIGGLGQLLAFLASAITFLWWFYRATSNAQRFADHPLEHGPGWAIGGFFVPFLNLVRPYQIARTIESIASNASQHSGILGAWWAAFIIDNIAGNVEFRLIDDHTSQDVVFVIMAITTVTGTIAAFFCWRAVWYLDNLLAERAKSPEDIAKVFS
jgi:hypothetical protein